VFARKQDKLYVGEFIDNRSEMDVCVLLIVRIVLVGEDFNVDLILPGMLLFSTRILVFCAIVLVGSLSSFLYRTIFKSSKKIGQILRNPKDQRSPLSRSIQNFLFLWVSIH